MLCNIFHEQDHKKKKKANQHSCLCVLKQRIILCEHQWYWAICRSPSPSRGGLTDVRRETRSKGNRLAVLVSVTLLSPFWWVAGCFKKERRWECHCHDGNNDAMRRPDFFHGHSFDHASSLSLSLCWKLEGAIAVELENSSSSLALCHRIF